MRARWLFLGVIVLLTLAATSAPARVEADDPCGDVVFLEAHGERMSFQPDDWSSFDLERVVLEEVGERAKGTHEVVLTLDLCGDAVEPDSVDEGFQLYRFAWDVDGECRRVVEVGWEGTSVHIVGDVGVWTWRHRGVREVCRELSAGPTSVWEWTTDYELHEDALTIEGDRIVVRLRAEHYPAFADSFAVGAVFASPRLTTTASVPAPGSSGCLPPDGPTGPTCAAARDGDRLDLPDLVLTDR